MEALIHYISTLPDEKLALSSLEEMALCAAWFDSFDKNDPKRMVNGDMRKQLDRWVKCVIAPPDDTQGYRQQPILRRLINAAVQSSLDLLERDELDVLYFAYALALRSKKEHLFKRPMDCIQPYLHILRDVRAELTIDSGLPTIDDQYTFCCGSTLKEAPPRDMRSFAGLDLPHRGPVLIAEGHVKVLDDLPDDCAVITEVGNAYVNGVVYGKLAASDHCEIRGNIAGTAVSRKGEIHCAHIMNQALVISKEGQISLSRGESPRIVFAGDKITVTGDVLGGHWFSRSMAITGTVYGGEIHAAGPLVAQRFECTETRRLTIILRSSLNCQDYGELLTAEAMRIMSNAYKLRGLLNNQLELLQMTERESDEYAGNVLVFLLGEDDSTKRIAEVQQMRQRAAYLDRIISTAHILLVSAEDQMAPSTREYMADNNNNKTLLDNLNMELDELAREGNIGQELFEIRDDITFLSHHLNRKAITSGRLREIMDQLQVLYTKITRKHDVLVQNIEVKDAALEHAMGKREILAHAKAECARYDVMEQVIKVGMSRQGSNAFRKKATDRYVALMRRYIENRFARMSTYRKAIEERQTRIRIIREQLWNEYNVSLPAHVLNDTQKIMPEVTGHFGEGVLICAWQHLMEDAKVGMQGVEFTIESGEGVLTYARTHTGAVKLTAGEPETPATDEDADSAIIEA